MPSLSSKFEKEGKKGLVVIGVTDESVDTVDSWFAKKQPRYPIVILEDKTFEKALGVKFFPTGAVMDPSGKVTYSGSAGGTSSPLKTALKSATKKPLFPKDLGKAHASMMAGDPARAWSDVVALQAKAEDDDELAKWVKRFSESLTKQAADTFAAAKAKQEEGLIYQAVDMVEPIAESKQPFPVTEEAASWLGSMVEAEGYADEIKAGSLYEKARLKEKEGEYTAAAKAFLKAEKKFPETRLAEAARSRAVWIVDSGYPGYSRGCSSCKKERRACSKHEEKVKL